MIFCEDCRIKKNYPRSSGYPHVGVSQNSKCEICGKTGDQHDVPGLFLVPEVSRTLEQKLIYRSMQEAYQQKAESLMVTHVSGAESGKINHVLTDLLRGILVDVNGKTDWYTTYQLRLKTQEAYQQVENTKRDRRNYVL